MTRGRKPKFEGKTSLMIIPVSQNTHRALSHLAFVWEEESVPDVIRLGINYFLDKPEIDASAMNDLKEKLEMPLPDDTRNIQTKLPIDRIRQLSAFTLAPEFGDFIPRPPQVARIAVEEFVEMQNINPAFLTTTGATWCKSAQS